MLPQCYPHPQELFHQGNRDQMQFLVTYWLNIVLYFLDTVVYFPFLWKGNMRQNAFLPNLFKILLTKENSLSMSFCPQNYSCLWQIELIAHQSFGSLPQLELFLGSGCPAGGNNQRTCHKCIGPSIDANPIQEIVSLAKGGHQGMGVKWCG